VTAVARPDVMSKLNLSPVKQQQILMIMEQMKAAQDQLQQTQRDQMMATFRNRGQGGPGQGGPGQGGPGGFGPGQGGFGRAPGQVQPPGAPGQGRPGQAGPGQGGPGQGGPGQGGPGQGGPGGFDRNQFMSRMQEMTEKQDAIREQAEALIAKQLTSKQKQTYNKMLGEPFDLSLLLQQPRGRDQGRGRGGEAPGQAPGAPGVTGGGPPGTPPGAPAGEDAEEQPAQPPRAFGSRGQAPAPR